MMKAEVGEAREGSWCTKCCVINILTPRPLGTKIFAGYFLKTPPSQGSWKGCRGPPKAGVFSSRECFELRKEPRRRDSVSPGVFTGQSSREDGKACVRLSIAFLPWTKNLTDHVQTADIRKPFFPSC